MANSLNAKWYRYYDKIHQIYTKYDEMNDSRLVISAGTPTEDIQVTTCTWNTSNQTNDEQQEIFSS